MALLVTLAAIAVPSLARSMRGHNLDGQADRLLALTEYGRDEAVSQGGPDGDVDRRRRRPFSAWTPSPATGQAAKMPAAREYHVAGRRAFRSGRAGDGVVRPACRARRRRDKPPARLTVSGTHGGVIVAEFAPDGTLDPGSLPERARRGPRGRIAGHLANPRRLRLRDREGQPMKMQNAKCRMQKFREKKPFVAFCSGLSAYRTSAFCILHSAFTLVEVLASLLFLAIAVPAIVGALGTCQPHLRGRRTRVASRAVSPKTNSTKCSWTTLGKNAAQSNGDFGTDFPLYHWQMTTADLGRRRHDRYGNRHDARRDARPRTTRLTGTTGN